MSRPKKYKTPEELKLKITDYFCGVVNDDVVPTKSGLTYHLGFVSKTALNEYLGYEEAYSYVIKEAFIRIEIWWEKKLAGNCVTGSIFWLKNNAGYADKTETRHSGEVSLTAPKIA
ncbi:hypothetical protein LCGC14_0970450 [marine sediment metagenome]|uniref:Uncharacterized protein n=1 Tax=marine sediment metagenome TaxID=412755 RepID=A0A0F9NBV5_9ZZZZ